jgi:predicted DsbA family dithiol-disulfide isomerase
MKSPLIVDYFSDVLCVWAWIAQQRIDELEQQWGEKIELRHHYLNLFGDMAARIENKWSERGSYDGFGQHVVESAAPYITEPLNSDIWTNVRPATSANAHLVIKAAGLVDSTTAAVKLAFLVRRSFYSEALDIGRLPVLLGIASEAGIDAGQIQESLNDGSAAAALMSDYLAAQQQDISGSPSWVMNNGRQKLYGNVGYHVLHANVEGLLSNSGEEASWC